MLELHIRTADVVGCYGRPQALDEVTGEGSVRVAPDELLLLGHRERLAQIEAELGALDEHGVVVDLSGGFAVFALGGDDRLEAFRRLSAIQLPPAPALAQGLLAEVPSKILVRDDELVLLVSSALAHHVPERVRAACVDLAPSEMQSIESLVDEGSRG